MLALLTPAGHVALKETTPITIPFHESHRAPTPNRAPTLVGMGSLPLALMAKRRGDLLREQSDDAGDFDVDESIELLRAQKPRVDLPPQSADRRATPRRAGRQGECNDERALDDDDAACRVRARAQVPPAPSSASPARAGSCPLPPRGAARTS